MVMTMANEDYEIGSEHYESDSEHYEVNSEHYKRLQEIAAPVRAKGRTSKELVKKIINEKPSTEKVFDLEDKETFDLKDFDALLGKVRKIRRDCDRALARSYGSKSILKTLVEESEKVMGNYYYSTPEEATIANLRAGGEMSQVEVKKVVTLRVTVQDTLFGADAIDYCSDPDFYDEGLLEEISEHNVQLPGKDILMVQGVDVDEWDNVYGISRQK